MIKLVYCKIFWSHFVSRKEIILSRKRHIIKKYIYIGRPHDKCQERRIKLVQPICMCRRLILKLILRTSIIEGIFNYHLLRKGNWKVKTLNNIQNWKKDPYEVSSMKFVHWKATCSIEFKRVTFYQIAVNYKVNMRQYKHPEKC